MNSRCKLVMVIVCTISFATIWRIYSSRLTFDPKEQLREVTCRPCVEGWKEEAVTQKLDPHKTCSCDKCMPEDNAYFEQRYDKSVNLFLTMDGNPSQDEYNWWKVLQHEKGDLNKFKEVKERLLKLFSAKPDMPETHPDRCLTCAVVGNSGNLKGSHNGPRIDAHQFVIRMNKGQTAGFEADVGTRTTHRVMYPESGVDLDNTTHLILFPFKVMDLRWIMDAFTTGFEGRSYAPVKKYIKGNKDLVMVVNPVFMKYVHTSWLHKKGPYPSTGFMTLVLAMHVCDKVNVFGFGADKDGNWNHYWEELKNKKLKTGNHPGTLEYEIIQELAKQNIITFHRGW